MSQLKLGSIRVIFTYFQNCTGFEKYLKYNKHDSLHLARKNARIFVLERYVLLWKTVRFSELSAVGQIS